MSRPLLIASVKFQRPENRALNMTAVLTLDNGKRLDVTCGQDEPAELLIKRCANALIEVNQKDYWHPIMPGLVHALIKIHRAVIDHGRYSVHLLDDMDGRPYQLSRHEWNNATKLRFHGLIAKDDKAGAGYWILTRRGAQFLRGEIAIPAKVMTRNNEVVDHDDVMKTIDEVMLGETYFVDKESLEIVRPTLEPVQAGLGI